MSDDNLSFSQRIGRKPATKNLQIDDIDEDLRNGVWNLIDGYYLRPIINKYKEIHEHGVANKFFRPMWSDYFKLPIDEIDYETINSGIEILRKKYFNFTWDQVYDFLEYLTINHKPYSMSKSEFIEQCDKVFEREFSGYRFTGDKILAITSKEETETIETTMQSPIQEVNTHIKTAVSLLSDKQNPDPRNSIKESISAVEAICKKIVGNQSITLGTALGQLESKGVTIHPDQIEAFKKFYGFTSDASGVRHSQLEGKITVNFDDAKFMLVSCSAFVNYLISKSKDAGISLT